MPFRPFWSCSIASVLACVLAGCGSGSRVDSGFLSDYGSLRADPIRDGARSYFNPSRGLGSYDTFFIEPVVIHFAADAEGTTIDPDQLAELAAYFRDYIAERLDESYTVVDGPRSGALRLRIAITDIKKGNSVLNVLPQTKLMGVGLGGASMEAEAFDVTSHERIAAFMETAKGSQFALEGAGPLDNAKQVARVWGDDFVARVDAAHGR